MHVRMHFLLVATSLAAANAFVPSPTKQLARRPAQPPLGVMMAKKPQVQQKKKKFSAGMSGEDLCAWATRTGCSADDVDVLREGKYDGEKMASSNLRELQQAGVSLEGATRLMDGVEARTALPLSYWRTSEANIVEEESIVIRSEAEFNGWAGDGPNAGELKFISRDPKTRERTKVVVLNSLLAASRAVLDLDENSHLWYRRPSDSLKGSIENLESWRATASTGLEKESNRAVQKSQYLRGKLGELKAVAEGRSVLISERIKVQAKQGGEKEIMQDRIQLDGVFLNSKVVLMNEAKWGLSRDKVKKCVSKKNLLEIYLQKMINSPDAFHTDPPEAKAELVQAGLTDVRVVMSCHSALPDAQDECKIERFFVCKPNGDAFSVEEASTTP